MPVSCHDFPWRRALLAVAAGAAVFLGVGQGRGAGDGASGDLMAAAAVEEVLKQNAGGLMAVPGVVGVAVGACSGKPCIRVLVARKTPELMQKLPAMLEGYPVVVDETGPIRPFDRG